MAPRKHPHVPDLRAVAPSEARRSAPAHTHAPAPAGADAMRALQRRIGNRATAQLLAVTAEAEPATEAQQSGRLEVQPATEAPSDGEPVARLERDAPSSATATDGPDAVAVRKPASKPGNGVVARKPSPSRRETVARQASARPGNAVVRRKIELDGTEADLAGLLKQASDMKERVILANWGWSQVMHDFESSDKVTAAEKLDEAVASAKSQAQDVPALYSAANLAFLTKGEGRLPTLYFISGATSGRIRQQHGSGPAVISQSDKTDYFFNDQKKMRSFQRAARDARSHRAAFNPNLGDYGATTVPTAGYFHFEVTYSGSVPTKLHPSGGTVDTAIGGYDDTKIQVIYNQAIGLST
ncbi:MAG: hypothetical protein WEB13_02695 [Dehalococcoidia bacterium]